MRSIISFRVLPMAAVACFLVTSLSMAQAEGEALDGLHTGLLEYQQVNRAPSSAIRSR